MNKNIFKIALAAGILFMSMACNDFLDELPDKRAELDTEEKIAQILISAYPTELSTMLFEFMSDNMNDNGPNYGTYFNQTAEQSYLFQDITDIAWDSPYRTWQQCYAAIASANQALDAIEKMGTPESLLPTQAEALLCRAYAHFWLANTFCIAYNPVSSGTDPGIPYVDEPETIVGKEYERRTVSYVYERLNEDIEKALPNIGSNYRVPKYHFNRQAAYAFAAKFNLFYGNWDKAIEYASVALGNNPANYLRVYTQYLVSDPYDIHPRYISANDPTNFMIMTQRSLWGRIYSLCDAPQGRYGMPLSIAYKTSKQYFPWSGTVQGADNRTYTYGAQINWFYPIMQEIFEYSDVSAGIGQPHTVLCALTGGETLFIRAEAYVMKNELQLAANDLNAWYTVASTATRSYTYAQIVDFYRNNSRRGTYWDTPEVQSRFSDFTNENQLFMFHAVHAAKRLETLYTGSRWLDIKRHGMVIRKRVMTTMQAGEYLVIAPYHGSTAIQLPQDVIIAGLPANARPDFERVPM